jgi:hypothetical protein
MPKGGSFVFVAMGLLMGVVCAALSASVTVVKGPTWKLTARVQPKPQTDQINPRANNAALFGAHAGGGCGLVHTFDTSVLVHAAYEWWSTTVEISETASLSATNSETWEQQDGTKQGTMELEEGELNVEIKKSFFEGRFFALAANKLSFIVQTTFQTNILPGQVFEAKDEKDLTAQNSPYTNTVKKVIPNTKVNGDHHTWQAFTKGQWKLLMFADQFNKQTLKFDGEGKINVKIRLSAKGS